MTTQPVTGTDMATEDPWSEALGSTAKTARARVSTLAESMPGELEAVAETMVGAWRAVDASLSSAQDDSLLVGASMASGLAIGLLLGNAPRILAAAAVVAAVSLGATLVQRHPRRQRAVFGRPVMA